MAPRRRAVERATFRRTVTDRVVAVILAIVVASGLMSVLPGTSQRAVSQTACRVATLGLGTCGAPGLDLADTELAPPRCPTLATLDRTLPEVRERQLVAAHGLPVTISTERSGDIEVRLGSAPQPEPPNLLQGQVRPDRTIIDGVSVPAQAEWVLPRGQGLDDLVLAVQDGHHRYVQSRSALALLATVLGRSERTVPEPTLTFSQVRLDQQLWPRVRASPSPPKVAGTAGSSRVPVRSSSALTVDLSRPALSSFSSTTRETAVVVPMTGTVGGEPVTGTLRFVRNGSGAITSVLVGVVGAGPLVTGEPKTSLPGPAVAYVSVPVQTASEQALVASWFASGQALVVPLDELLGLRAPQADDQVGSFLARAATVTVLRYALVSTTDLQARVTAELGTHRRTEWDGVRMVEAAAVAPTSTGAGRTLVDDPGCRT